jgi:hypothetical protein
LGYNVGGVPRRYEDQVQLSSVLRPNYGKMQTDADIINATARVLQNWRNRATQLATAGYPPFARENEPEKAKLSAAIGCKPTFVITYGPKGRRSCRLQTICPFCYAREVRQQWLVIDRAFFPPAPKNVKQRIRVVDTGHETKKSSSFTRSVKDGEISSKSNYDLVRRFFTYQVPLTLEVKQKTGITGEDGVRYKMSGVLYWLRSRTQGQPDPAIHRQPECRALLKAAGPGGAVLETIHFRRVTGGPAGQYWHVQVWQLILAADGTQVPVELPKGTVAPRNHKVFVKPKRRLVVSQVARALHYPNWLIDMRVPVEEVIEYLKIRREFRLIANYGRFRPSKA